MRFCHIVQKLICDPRFFREVLTAECYQELSMQCISLLDKIEWDW